MGGPYFFFHDADVGEGGLGGLTGRIGAQLTNSFALYANAGGFLGGGSVITFDPNAITVSTEFIAAATVGAMAEIDLDYLYVGLGPELVVLGAAGPTSAAGACFGVTGRVGVWNPRQPRQNRRAGFHLGLDLQTMFVLPVGVLVVPMLAFGFDMY